MAITDASGKIVQCYTYDYEAFGQLTALYSGF
ncbi:MAG: hypothetical protein IH613_01315 [Desulfuromonadales bacterium]|nr:hypothetical protein [Desulfuromonadales bacterium]